MKSWRSVIQLLNAPPRQRRFNSTTTDMKRPQYFVRAHLASIDGPVEYLALDRCRFTQGGQRLSFASANAARREAARVQRRLAPAGYVVAAVDVDSHVVGGRSIASKLASLFAWRTFRSDAR